MIRDLVNLTEKLQAENAQWIDYIEELETRIALLTKENVVDYDSIVKAGQEVIDRSTGSEA